MEAPTPPPPVDPPPGCSPPTCDARRPTRDACPTPVDPACPTRDGRIPPAPGASNQMEAPLPAVQPAPGHASSTSPPAAKPFFSSVLPRQMKWLPKGMDPSSACRVLVKVPAYFELPGEDYHVTENLKFVVDKDTTNWMDLLADLKSKIKYGNEQELHVYFLDKNSRENVEIASDNALLNAFSQYWDIRKLTLEAIVHDIDELEQAVPSIAAPPSTEGDEVVGEEDEVVGEEDQVAGEEDEEEPIDELELLGPNYVPEYVGLDDEGQYLGGNDDGAAPSNIADPSNLADACLDVAIVPNVVLTMMDRGKRRALLRLLVVLILL